MKSTSPMQILLFIMASIIGTRAIGADSIIVTNDLVVNKIPSDVVKMFTMVHDMVNDLVGGCEECITSEKAIPLPKIDVPAFKKLVNILIAVKITLNAKDLSKVKESKLRIGYQKDYSIAIFSGAAGLVDLC